MISTEEFFQKFTETQQALLRDYAEDGENTSQPACHVMHRELGLGQTPAEDADEKIAELRSRGLIGDDWEPDGIDFTEEHRALHEFIAVAISQAAMSGMPVTQLVALMFVIGRRMGMAEAVSMLEGVEAESDHDWLSDALNPSTDASNTAGPAPQSTEDGDIIAPEGQADDDTDGGSDVTDAS